MARKSSNIQNEEYKAKIAIIEFLAEFTHDPVGFVWAAYPWGEGELEGQEPQKWQLEELGYIRDGLKTPNQVIQEVVASGHGIGKLHSYDMMLDTPSGNRRWGTLAPGDYVFGADGNPAKILQCHHYKNVRMFKVTFDDGSYAEVSSGHLWNVRGRDERRNNKQGYRTLSTLDIVNKGVKRPNGKHFARQWEIPIQGAVTFPEVDTSLHPYLMGVWLGDGSKGCPIYTKPYQELKDKIESLGYICKFNKDDSSVRILNSASLFKGGVFNCSSCERYIPDEYKYNSITKRMQLFCGLLDTDGEINTSGSIGYSTTSKKLATDVIWLARSLGCKAMLQPTNKKGWYYGDNGNKVQCRPCYRVTINAPFNPFTLNHRKNKYKPSKHRYTVRWIDKIEPIPNTDGMCITVDNSNGLYLCNDFIVTHNSALVAWIIHWAIATFEDTKGVVTANTEKQLMTKTWAELAKWHRLFIGKDLFVYTATAYYSSDKEHEKTWRIDAIAWSEANPEAFAGLHNQKKRILIIFDEASAIANCIWEVVEGATTDKDTEIIWCCFGNGTRNSGWFYDCFHKLRNIWHGRQIDSRAVAISNKTTIQKWIETYGEDSDFVKVRVRGMFPSAGDHQLISTVIATAAQERYKLLALTSYNFAPIVFGVDPAWKGADMLVVYMRQGNYSKVLMAIPKNDNDVLIAGKLAALEDKYGMTTGFIDQGYGTGIYSALKTMGRGDNWVLIPFNSSPEDDYYQNIRAEMWSKMRDWLKEGGAIEDNQVIYNDLIAPEAYINTRGKFQLESKDDMKARGIPSPNYGDALALTFAHPVRQNKNSKYKQAKAAGRIRKVGAM